MIQSYHHMSVLPRGQITEIPASSFVQGEIVEEEGHFFQDGVIGPNNGLAHLAAHASPVVCAVSAADQADDYYDDHT